ncbi:MAG: hypothetical protein QOF73_1128 [Thermomicrobiales bacterium]|jgi:hypothetical protein|nr:hypothetical protein [Thermomicrobiales bacterium]
MPIIVRRQPRPTGWRRVLTLVGLAAVLAFFALAGGLADRFDLPSWTAWVALAVGATLGLATAVSRDTGER